MTIKYENTDTLFGCKGPFVAESKAALADTNFKLFEALARKDGIAGVHACNILATRLEDFVSLRIEIYRCSYIQNLKAVYCGEPRIIYDNGGGITLQLPGFTHTYQDASQCIGDIVAWLEEGSTDGWCGNDESAVFEPTLHDLQNGGYQVVSVADMVLAPSLWYALDIDVSWDNVVRVREGLRDSYNLRLFGIDAINYKEQYPEAELNKYSDPIEDARDDISIEYAKEVMCDDPNLVYVDVDN